VPLFQQIFKTWDGTTKRDIILETVSYVPLANFQGMPLGHGCSVTNARLTLIDLYISLFKPLEARLLDNTPESQLNLLAFYGMLLHRWAITMLSAEQSPDGAKEAIFALTLHGNKLCLTLVQTAPTIATHLSILDFYDKVAALISIPTLTRYFQVAIPPSALVYILLFSQSPAVVSRLGRILSVYKKTLEVIMSRPDGRQLTADERERVNVFNGFLMDICNCVWRGRAFSREDTNALGCTLTQGVVQTLRTYLSGVDKEMPLEAAFGLSHSPSLSLLAIGTIRELEDDQMGRLLRRHAGPVTAQSLLALRDGGGLDMSWQDYRSSVLVYLEIRELGGLPELMYNTMKNLRNSRLPRPQGMET